MRMIRVKSFTSGREDGLVAVHKDGFVLLITGQRARFDAAVLLWDQISGGCWRTISRWKAAVVHPFTSLASDAIQEFPQSLSRSRSG